MTYLLAVGGLVVVVALGVLSYWLLTSEPKSKPEAAPKTPWVNPIARLRDSFHKWFDTWLEEHVQFSTSRRQFRVRLGRAYTEVETAEWEREEAEASPAFPLQTREREGELEEAEEQRQMAAEMAAEMNAAQRELETEAQELQREAQREAQELQREAQREAQELRREGREELRRVRADMQRMGEELRNTGLEHSMRAAGVEIDRLSQTLNAGPGGDVITREEVGPGWRTTVTTTTRTTGRKKKKTPKKKAKAKPKTRFERMLDDDDDSV